MTTAPRSVPTRGQDARSRFSVAFPPAIVSLEQDAEWCVVRTGEEWHQVRFHDYADVYNIPGFYEYLFYDVLQCKSPTMIRTLLQEATRRADVDPGNLRVLDLGAGNGMVGEQLLDLGAELVVGVDIIPEAKDALDRDRHGLYADYLVADMTDLSARQRAHLESFGFNCLTCVAALGFGDIPPDAFEAAYNLIEPGGWIAFNIKEDFLHQRVPGGFSLLIDEMIRRGTIEVRAKRSYRHRLATNGDPLTYVAFVGQKQRDIDFTV